MPSYSCWESTPRKTRPAGTPVCSGRAWMALWLGAQLCAVLHNPSHLLSICLLAQLELRGPPAAIHLSPFCCDVFTGVNGWSTPTGVSQWASLTKKTSFKRPHKNGKSTQLPCPALAAMPNASRLAQLPQRAWPCRSTDQGAPWQTAWSLLPKPAHPWPPPPGWQMVVPPPLLPLRRLRAGLAGDPDTPPRWLVFLGLLGEEQLAHLPLLLRDG